MSRYFCLLFSLLFHTMLFSQVVVKSAEKLIYSFETTGKKTVLIAIDTVHNKVIYRFGTKANTELEINLPEQIITILATGDKESFAINGYKKNNLTNGYDDIDYLQAMGNEIQSFASKSLY